MHQLMQLSTFKNCLFNNTFVPTKVDNHTFHLYKKIFSYHSVPSHKNFLLITTKPYNGLTAPAVTIARVGPDNL